ncbi:MAG TPA: hypothetical protein DCQ06_14345 [Myxococcales bacterium]|nr:hypothetical protein [Myxococcales bacterium]
MRWLELSPGYACNCRCTGCFSCSASESQQMGWPEVLRWLKWGRKGGAIHLWLSGGEPTIRRDFLRTLRAGKALGYERIKVQTNGMLFAYEGFAEKAIGAGMNEVNLLLKSLNPRIHDGLNRTPGSHQLLTKGLKRFNALDEPPRLAGDILLTTRNVKELPELIDHYLEQGLVHFNLWLFSLVDQGQRDLRRLVPRLTDCNDLIVEAYDRAKAAGATVCSLNTPYCLVPPSRWDMQFDAGGMELAVVNPGSPPFMLETSSIEQGIYVDECEGCALRPVCRGMRSDYLDLHGVDELQAIDQQTWLDHQHFGSKLDI